MKQYGKSGRLLVVLLIGVVELFGGFCFGDPFTDDSAIVAISREDHGDALANRRLPREITLAEALRVLTTYAKVTREEYMRLAHQPGWRGAVTLKDGATFEWTIERDYAAVVTDSRRNSTYLVRPDLAGKEGQDQKRTPEKAN